MEDAQMQEAHVPLSSEIDEEVENEAEVPPLMTKFSSTKYTHN